MNVQQLKRQLNIEADFLDEDQILQFYLDVSEQKCLNYLNLYTGSTSGYTGVNQPICIQQAILLLAAHYYVNRTPVAFAQGHPIPYTFSFLLDDYKNYTVA